MGWKQWTGRGRGGTIDVARPPALDLTAAGPGHTPTGTVLTGEGPGADQLALFPLSVQPGDQQPADAAGTGGAVPAATFAEAAAEVLRELDERLPMPTWTVSRVLDPLYTLLVVRSGVVAAGHAVRWQDTLCHVMVAQGGPRLVPDVTAAPAFAGQAMARENGVRAYTGAPLLGPDGRLLGSLCGLSRQPLDTGGLGERSWLRLLEQRAGDLAGLLGAELATLPVQRTADRRVAQDRGDDLTGLADRRGWGFLLQREEARARAYAEPSGVLLLDLGAARSVGPVRRAAAAAAAALQGRGSVVRLDGRRLGVLCTATDQAELRTLADTVQTAVLASGCMLTSGWALREPAHGLPGAWQQAERRLMSVRRNPATA